MSPAWFTHCFYCTSTSKSAKTGRRWSKQASGPSTTGSNSSHTCCISQWCLSTKLLQHRKSRHSRTLPCNWLIMSFHDCHLDMACMLHTDLFIAVHYTMLLLDSLLLFAFLCCQHIQSRMAHCSLYHIVICAMVMHNIDHILSWVIDQYFPFKCLWDSLTVTYPYIQAVEW